MQQSKLRRVLLGAVLAAAVIAAWRAWVAHQTPPLPKGIAAGNGRIESIQVDITAKYPGRLVQLLVNEGDLVRPDQILARIDTREIEAQLAGARAQVSRAEESLAKAKADLIEGESNLRFSEAEYQRGQVLVSRNAISREEWDKIRSSRDATRATVDARKASVNASQHSIEEALAEVSRFEVQIADSTLRSPVRGRVLYKLAEIGEVLASGGKVLTLVNLGDIYMEIYLPSREAALVPIGADAKIVLDVAPQYSAPAKVSFVSPESQFTPKQVETPSERDKLMFRVKLKIPEEVVDAYIERIKTGVRGVGYVRLDESVSWPDRLNTPMPPRLAASKEAKHPEVEAAKPPVAEAPKGAHEPKKESPAPTPDVKSGPKS
ncbi:HlyD family secretion protein [Aquisphaera insulae]|uniref:HlyD family secretion protein n=1 Tax=Aquisphaera insulae TaxID=2712864 RepID=UPI0013ECC6C0|nr:HlyD family efflux transporter periplasmic adaptor subunit [Aquisphaera insulae]